MTIRGLFVLAVVSLAGCGSELHSKIPSAAGPTVTPGEASPDREPTQRQIIYTATIDLVVRDLSATETQVKELVSAASGHVVTFREQGRTGGQRSGHWVVRLPQDRFESFVAQVVELGVPVQRQIDGQDVTEQFVDLTARLKNKKHLEERVLKLLDERTGEIKDVIEVESQLGRVREEIELLEGKLRYLSDRIALTTVTLTAREDQSYTPPQAPTFARKARDAWARSWEGMRQLGEGLALVAVAATPWLAVLGLVVGPAVWWMRRRRMR